MAEKEYIEREALLDILEGLYDLHLMTLNYAAYAATQDCMTAVAEALAADVTEVRHGEWITKGENGLLICSECGTNRPFDVQGDKIEYWQGNFCNICGAKMDGERKADNG